MGAQALSAVVGSDLEQAAVFTEAVWTDFGNDGDLDLVAGSFDGWLVWYEHLEPGVFAPPVDLRRDVEPVAVTTADIDADGQTDVIAAFMDSDTEWSSGVACE